MYFLTDNVSLTKKPRLEQKNVANLREIPVTASACAAIAMAYQTMYVLSVFLLLSCTVLADSTAT